MTSDLAIAQGQDTEYSLMTESVWPVLRERERKWEDCLPVTNLVAVSEF